MVIFTNDMGQQVEVSEEEMTVIEEKPEYTVVQAKQNPGGQVMTKVIYNNPVRRNVGRVSPTYDMFEEELKEESIIDPLEADRIGEEMVNPRRNGHCMNPGCHGVMRNGHCSNPGCHGGHKMNPGHGGLPYEKHARETRKYQTGSIPMGAVQYDTLRACGRCGGTGDSPINEGKCTVCDGYGQVVSNNPRMNPTGSVISWRNLRLSAAIESEKRTATGKIAAGARRVANLGMEIAAGKVKANKSIRQHAPLLMLATAEHWFDYVRNMSAIDVGAELSAEVSPQEQLAIYHFLKEWEMDPTHRAFRNRVDVGADIDSELTKAQIVYDIMTGSGPNPLSSADMSSHRYDKMFKLALDIISSIRLNTYNYYTINKLHVQEGDRVFMDFRSRYVPLSAMEVSMVSEMQSNISDSRSYAFQTTSSETQAIEADQLMRKAVSSYQVGDTRTTKSILDVLMAAPFGYTPLNERISASHVASSEKTAKAKFQAGEVFRLQVGGGDKFKQIPEEVKDGNSIFVTTKDGKADPNKFMSNDGKLKKADNNTVGVEVIVLDGFHSRKPVGILKGVGGGGKGSNTWVYEDYNAFIKKGTKTFEDKNQRDRRKKLQDAVKSKKNPKYSVSKKGGPQKRGKFLFMEIHHKNRLEMKRKASGQHGASKNTAKWSKGLNKIFPGMQLVQTGTLKSTGEEAPYRIRLPTTHFKRVTDAKTGKPTIGIKKGDAKLKKVWKDLKSTYGTPKHTPDKGTHHRYIIPVNQQGSYQAEVRRKVGKAKAKR